MQRKTRLANTPVPWLRTSKKNEIIQTDIGEVKFMLYIEISKHSKIGGSFFWTFYCHNVIVYYKLRQGIFKMKFNEKVAYNYDFSSAEAMPFDTTLLNNWIFC